MLHLNFNYILFIHELFHKITSFWETVETKKNMEYNGLVGI
jgi:hypothetical protein